MSTAKSYLSISRYFPDYEWQSMYADQLSGIIFINIALNAAKMWRLGLLGILNWINGASAAIVRVKAYEYQVQALAMQ